MKMEERRNLQERLIKDVKGASQPEGFKFSWTGDPSDKEGIRMLFNEEVGYMRDGMVMSPDGRILGTYARTVDYQEQKDGSRLNEIIFRPVSQEELDSNLRNRLKP
jgi:hypothetical protein